jgi:hypothetical protein
MALAGRAIRFALFCSLATPVRFGLQPALPDTRNQAIDSHRL